MRVHFGNRLPETQTHYKALGSNPEQDRLTRSNQLVPNPQKVREAKAQLLFELSRKR